MTLLTNFQNILESFIIPFQWNRDLKENFLKSCGRTQTHVVCWQEIFVVSGERLKEKIEVDHSESERVTIYLDNP